MIEHGDDLAWLHRGLDGYYLTFAEGIPAEELAVRLGAPADSPVLDADTVAAIERAAPPWEQRVPDIGRIGDAGNGWSFVLLPCTAYWEHGRTGPESPYGRYPSHGIRTVSAVYTGMDPAQIDVMHDGQHLWGYSDNGFNGSRPHLLNTALADLGWNADEKEEEDEDGEVPPHAPSYELLYAALGNFFGLIGLPRAAIENRTLPGMFCEPRELPRHEYADAPMRPVRTVRAVRRPDGPEPCGEGGGELRPLLRPVQGPRRIPRRKTEAHRGTHRPQPQVGQRRTPRRRRGRRRLTAPGSSTRIVSRERGRKDDPPGPRRSSNHACPHRRRAAKPRAREPVPGPGRDP